MTVWSLSRAKNDLDEVIQQTLKAGPQMIKLVRWPVVVIVPIRRWRAMLRRYPELEEFFWPTKRHLPPRKTPEKVSASQSTAPETKIRKAANRK